jgi:hypothetical protein
MTLFVYTDASQLHIITRGVWDICGDALSQRSAMELCSRFAAAAAMFNADFLVMRAAVFLVTSTAGKLSERSAGATGSLKQRGERLGRY